MVTGRLPRTGRPSWKLQASVFAQESSERTFLSSRTFYIGCNLVLGQENRMAVVLDADPGTDVEGNVKARLELDQRIQAEMSRCGKRTDEAEMLGCIEIRTALIRDSIPNCDRSLAG